MAGSSEGSAGSNEGLQAVAVAASRKSHSVAFRPREAIPVAWR